MATTRSTADPVEAFLQRQRELLAKEREEDVKANELLLSKCEAKLLERKGLAITTLTIVNSPSIGLGGKLLVELSKPSYTAIQRFPPNSFRTGDLARVESNKSPVSRSKQTSQTVGRDGVVYKITDTRITLALDPDGSDDLSLPDPCRIIKLSNTVTFERMEKTLDRVAEIAQKEDCLPLHRVLLAKEPRSKPLKDTEITFFDADMNESQKQAVKFCLTAPEVACIHGPPGTGKSRTVIELILQFTTVTPHNPKPLRVLVCGASNLSVDNILERLLKLEASSNKRDKLKVTRIGHPARVMAKTSILGATLDVQASCSDQAAIANDVKKELEGTLKTLDGKNGKRPRGPERKALWGSVRDLRKEYRQREARVVESVISQAQVVLATCHSAGSRQLHGLQFDVLIIDEATQALEAVCWIPILKAKKLIMAGDPMQLPPTVVSKTSMKATKSTSGSKPNTEDPRLSPSPSLSYTLFDRLEDMCGPSVKRMLEIQYRMNASICKYPSEALYNAKLRPHASVENHLLGDLPDVASEDEDLSQPVVFFDTAGCEYYERMDDEMGEGSKYNEHEAEIVVRWVTRLISLGILPAQIALITPYQAQVNYLTQRLASTYGSELEIGTVDGMQGREKEAIVMCLVRSNDKRDVGFLADKRRLNVAMTRARRQLCIIGDSSTVVHGGSYLKSWMAWLEENADVRYGLME